MKRYWLFTFFVISGVSLTAFAPLPQEADDSLAWIIFFVALILLLLMAFLFSREGQKGAAATKNKGKLAQGGAQDDLTKIEGVGPKTDKVLKEAGINTFAALAEKSPQDLNQILDKAGLRLGVPDSWPNQAALAAAGKWDELKSMQENLQGGRH